jgi:hypothetical protein
MKFINLEHIQSFNSMKNRAGRLRNFVLNRRWWGFAYLAPILVAPLILLGPVWLTGKALFWGVVSLQFVPWRTAAWAILRSGHLPIWNSLNGMGAPLLANYQSALLYPPNWVYFLILAVSNIGWAAWGLAIVAALHLVWAGLGIAFLARRLGIDKLGQTVSGLAFALSGYLVGRLGFLSINASVAWLPWVILGVEGILARNQPPALIGNPVAGGELGRSPSDHTFKKLLGEIWDVRGLALCLGMQLLAGHAQIAWYTLLLAGLWATLGAWRREEFGRDENSLPKPLPKIQRIGTTWARLLLAVLLGIGISAIQLVPTLEYLRESQRSTQVDYEFAMTYSFWPWRFLSLLAPDMFGNPSHGDYWGYGNYWEDALYIGMLPLLLAIFALVKRKSNTWPLFCLSLISMVLALGKNTPIFPWLYQHVLTFALFQAPTRWSIWAVFCLALMGGWGVTAWRRPRDKGLYWSRLGTAGALAVTIGSGLAWYFLREINITYLRATALAGIWGFGAGVLTLLAPPEDDDPVSSPAFLRKTWPGAVVIIVLADLWVAGWGLNPGIDRSFYYQSPYVDTTVHPARLDGRIYLPEDLEEYQKYDRFMRFDSFYPEEDWQSLHQVLLSDLNLLNGYSSVNNYDPLVPGRYAQWMQRLAIENPTQQESILNLMAVSSVENIDSGAQNGVSFKQVGSGSRVRWLPCTIFVSAGEAALEKVYSDEVNLDTQIILEGKDDAGTQECQGTDQQPRLKVTSETANDLNIQVDSSLDGWLLLSDVWYPGWRATVDGKGVRIWKADYLFRAIQLKSGAHEISFTYRPVSFYLGTLITVITILFFMLLAVLKGR